MANNLYDYYTSQGQALPSVQQRQSIAQQAGISGYNGTAGQNTQLLNFLQNQATPTTMPINPVISTNALMGNGVQPQMPSVNPAMNPASFVAGLTPITPITQTAVNPAAPGALQQTTGQVGTLEGQRGMLTQRLAQAQNQLLGKGGEQLRLEAVANIPQSVKDINALNEQIVQKKAAFDQAQENFRSGQVGTQELSTGKIAQVQRNAAVQLGGLSALLMAKQGSLDSAKAEIDRTLALEFDPIKQEIENTKTFLELNNQDLSRAESRQATALKIQLDRQAADLDYFRSIKKMTYDNLLKNGGSSSQMSALLGAKSLADISKINQDAYASGTPSERVESLNNTLTLLDTIKNSNGLNSRVGPVGLARRFLAFGDAFGAGDAFAGSVHQLTSQETLNQLINLKAQGGTLGALSDQERIMLQNAASKINAWEKKDNQGGGKGIWDITQKQFKLELDRLTTITQNALIRAGAGSTQLSSEDYQQVQGLLQVSGSFNPGNFY